MQESLVSIENTEYDSSKHVLKVVINVISASFVCSLNSYHGNIYCLCTNQSSLKLRINLI